MVKTIIIGAGISGLIAANIIEDSIVLERSNKIGGDFINSLGPKYIHCTQENLEFFSKFYQIKEEEVIQKFYKNDTFIDCIEDADIKIYNEKMGYEFSSSMNRGEKTNKGFFINSVEQLNKNVVLNCQIIGISLKNKKINCFVNDHIKVYEYDNLISTVDLKKFAELIHEEKLVEGKIFAKPVTYIDCEVKENNLNFDFFYNFDEKYRFYRCTKNRFNKNIIFEFISEKDQNYTPDVFLFLEKHGIVIKKLSTHTNPLGKINSKDLNLEQLQEKGIFFLGRNANYSHDRIQDVVKNIQKIKNTII
jgi:hypothetical protein